MFFCLVLSSLIPYQVEPSHLNLNKTKHKVIIFAYCVKIKKVIVHKPFLAKTQLKFSKKSVELRTNPTDKAVRYPIQIKKLGFGAFLRWLINKQPASVSHHSNLNNPSNPLDFASPSNNCKYKNFVNSYSKVTTSVGISSSELLPISR